MIDNETWKRQGKKAVKILYVFLMLYVIYVAVMINRDYKRNPELYTYTEKPSDISNNISSLILGDDDTNKCRVYEHFYFIIKTYLMKILYFMVAISGTQFIVKVVNIEKVMKLINKIDDDDS